MDHEMEASAQRVRDHPRRPLDGSRDLLMETAGNTVYETVPAVLVIGGADLLGALPGDFDLEVLFASGERGAQASVLAVGQVLAAVAQDVAIR